MAIRHRRAERRRRDRWYKRSYKRALLSLKALSDLYQKTLFDVDESIKYAIRSKRIERVLKVSSQVMAIRAMKLRAEALFTKNATVKAIVEKTKSEYYANLEEIVNAVALLSSNSLTYPMPETPNRLEQAYAMAHYYCPLNPSDIHLTMCAVRLTPYIIQALEGREADFYIVSQTTVSQLTDPYKGSNSPLYHLLQFIITMLRRKSKREKFRKKRKGHFGKIRFDEPIHTLMLSSFEEKAPIKLSLLMLGSTLLARQEALTRGKPERFSKEVDIVAIIGRKSKYSKGLAKEKSSRAVAKRLKTIKRIPRL